ncbi:MAG: WecB/TagA/CpsF family glycosyltransferase, partial [Opitutus sp.]
MPPAAAPPRYNVLGVGVSELTLSRAQDFIVGVRGTLRQGYICLGTAHGLALAKSDAGLRRIYNESWLTTPDGMPLVWLGPAGVERVYGPDLMLAVCDRGRSVGLRHYLYGGRDGVAEQLGSTLCARFPGLEISGLFTP